MKLFPLLIASVLPLANASAAEKPGTATLTESSTGMWAFSLIPKAFQKNPLVDQTVITEMTDEGKKRPLVTPSNPAYYVAEAGGYRVVGHGPGGEVPPTDEIMEGTMRRAMAVNGYRPTTPDNPPTIAIVYHWGSHNTLDAGYDDSPDSAFVDVGSANLLSRAALIGGTKFAKEMAQAIYEQSVQDEVTATLPAEFRSMFEEFGPLQRFCERDHKTRQLYDLSQATCYYVVASAYDYAALARGQLVLLWRSKMTLDAQGISMTESLPNLLLYAGKYFGRDMTESATIYKRIMPEGHVEVGTPEMRGYIDSPKKETSSREKATSP